VLNSDFVIFLWFLRVFKAEAVHQRFKKILMV